MNELEIIWTKQAKEALKYIFDYYKDKSISGAKNVRADLLQSLKTVYFSKQYQIDNINPNYRRIIVRDYKVLYIENNGTIRVMDIVSTRQSPAILKTK